MMTSDDRRAVLTEWKERKPAGTGIYAVRCAAGGCWVGQAPNLASIRNRLWFALRMGSGKPASLQSAWQTHGEAQFSLEVLETLPEEAAEYGRQRTLKALLTRWADALGAEVI